MSEKSPTPIRYALFAWGVEVESVSPSALSAWMIGRYFHDGEEWKDESKRKPKEKLGFVAFVSSPSDVIAEIRKNPTRRYVLMTGTVEAVQVAMPVFVGGKNLATLNQEWGHQEEPA